MSMVDLHLRTLQRRLVHLRERVRKAAGNHVELGFDKAESAALDWALTFLHQVLGVERDATGAPKPKANVLEHQAVMTLNQVKASPQFPSLPVDVQLGVDAVLMMAEQRRTGLTGEVRRG